MAVKAYGTIEFGFKDTGIRQIHTPDEEFYGIALATLDKESGLSVKEQHDKLGPNDYPVYVLFHNVESVDIVMKNLESVRDFLIKRDELKEKENEPCGISQENETN